MNRLLLGFAVATALAAPAVAQSRIPPPINPIVSEGTTSLAAKAVTNVYHDPVNQVMSFSLTLLDNSATVVDLVYGTPSGILGAPEKINPQVAELMRRLADKKRTDPANFYYFYMNPVKYKRFGGITTYKVGWSTVVSLDAVIPYVPKALSGSNTRGGLVRAVVCDQGLRTVARTLPDMTVEYLTFKSYGYITLKREDGTSFTEFDAHILREPFVTPDRGILQPLTPSPSRLASDYDAYKLMDDALAARQLVIPGSPYPAYEINDARVLYKSCSWTTILD